MTSGEAQSVETLGAVQLGQGQAELLREVAVELWLEGQDFRKLKVRESKSEMFHPEGPAQGRG